MAQLVNVIFILVFIFAIAAFSIWVMVRGDQILDKWATDNGYRIIKREHWLFWQPFRFPAVRSAQSVYHVTVLDAAGNEKQGLVFCGSWLLGVIQNTAYVKWDD
ncbi:MAG: hypothetical protein KF716_12260 [Anaerolineae bacterium]|nr:hypothetical protein [Anaerolineae bacterium]